VERVGSLGPVTVPPVSSTLSRSCMVSFCSTSPGMATGTPGGYGHSNSALTLPAAAAPATLQIYSIGVWLCHFATGSVSAANVLSIRLVQANCKILCFDSQWLLLCNLQQLVSSSHWLSKQRQSFVCFKRHAEYSAPIASAWSVAIVKTLHAVTHVPYEQ